MDLEVMKVDTGKDFDAMTELELVVVVEAAVETEIGMEVETEVETMAEVEEMEVEMEVEVELEEATGNLAAPMFVTLDDGGCDEAIGLDRFAGLGSPD